MPPRLRYYFIFTSLTLFSFNSHLYAEEKLTEPSAKFLKALTQDPWLQKQYQQYLQKQGYKAFAVFWEGDFVKAYSFSEDKLTSQFAQREALLLCNAYAGQTIGCTIEHESRSTRKKLVQGSFPTEISAYRDLKHWQRYQTSSKHKAIAGNTMGILGSGYNISKDKAERQALQQCYQNTHFSVPHCYIIESE